VPRKGKGQKIQAASGQTYGKAKAQRDAQNVVPLPTVPDPASSSRTAGPVPSPGRDPFNRPSARPGEHVTTPGSLGPQQPTALDQDRRFKAAMLLPMLEQMSSEPDASPHLRNSVRKLKAFIGNPADFADRNP